MRFMYPMRRAIGVFLIVMLWDAAELLLRCDAAQKLQISSTNITGPLDPFDVIAISDALRREKRVAALIKRAAGRPAVNPIVIYPLVKLVTNETSQLEIIATHHTVNSDFAGCEIREVRVQIEPHVKFAALTMFARDGGRSTSIYCVKIGTNRWEYLVSSSTIYSSARPP